jgi:hypothetical protein
MIVALRCRELVCIHNQFSFPARQFYHFRDSGLWVEDYHLQRELEMLMVMIIVALRWRELVCMHNQFCISHKATLPLS